MRNAHPTNVAISKEEAIGFYLGTGIHAAQDVIAHGYVQGLAYIATGGKIHPNAYDAVEGWEWSDDSMTKLIKKDGSSKRLAQAMDYTQLFIVSLRSNQSSKKLLWK